MIRPEVTPITIVTSTNGNNKDAIFRSVLPAWKFSHRNPLYNEHRIHAEAPSDLSRPKHIAEQKAREDIAMAQVMSRLADTIVEQADLYVSGSDEKYFLYSDVMQVVHKPDGTVALLDKPKENPILWASASEDAMVQSGREVEIVNALSMIRTGPGGTSEPQTVYVRVKASMRPFTREELIEYALSGGEKTIAETSGGLSLANGGRKFYDQTRPLTVSIQESLDEEPREIIRYETWDTLPRETLKPFIVGALEPALVRLVEKTK